MPKVTLWPWSLTLNIGSISAVTWSNSVPNAEWDDRVNNGQTCGIHLTGGYCTVYKIRASVKKSSAALKAFRHTTSSGLKIDKNQEQELILGLESESKFFSTGVRVWTTDFLNSGVGVPQKNKDSASLSNAAQLKSTVKTKEFTNHTHTLSICLSANFPCSPCVQPSPQKVSLGKLWRSLELHVYRLTSHNALFNA